MTKTEVRIEPVLARVPEAAAYLNVSSAWIYKEISAGRMPVRRLGNNVRIPWEYLRERAKNSSDEDQEEN